MKNLTKNNIARNSGFIYFLIPTDPNTTLEEYAFNTYGMTFTRCIDAIENFSQKKIPSNLSPELQKKVLAIADHIKNILGKPHELISHGKSSDVCPFSRKLTSNFSDRLFFAELQINHGKDLDELNQARQKEQILTYLKKQCDFINENDVDLPDKKCPTALAIVVSPMRDSEVDLPVYVEKESFVGDRYHGEDEFYQKFVSSYQKEFVPKLLEEGCLISELGPRSEVSSVYSPSFFPSKTPYPIYFIRKVIPLDIPFLLRDDRGYPLEKNYQNLCNTFGEEKVQKITEEYKGTSKLYKPNKNTLN